MKRTLTLIALAAVASASFAQSTFRVTIENLGPQPLSPLFYSAGNTNFNIFDLNGQASAGIKAIAEGGNTAPITGLATAAGSDVAAFGTLPGGPITMGQTNSALFTTDEAHGWFSFAAMLGQTNDGFIGESVTSSDLFLFAGGEPRGFSMLITGLRAWDAGTEANTQNAADLGFLGGSGNPADPNHHIRIHDSIIQGVGDSYQLQPDWNLNTNLARVTVESVPEPTSFALIGLGVAALIKKRRK
jgi:hypothetical protein